MIPGESPVYQALLGTLFTWFLTAVGASCVFLLPRSLTYRTQRLVLDGSLGFAGGVMLAASYWSLLAPAIEAAEESGFYGAHSYAPVAAGFAAGAVFVWGADILIPAEAGDTVAVLTGSTNNGADVDEREEKQSSKANKSSKKAKVEDEEEEEIYEHTPRSAKRSSSTTRSRKVVASSSSKKKKVSSNGRNSSRVKKEENENEDGPSAAEKRQSWHRILLLVIAIATHNVPEGMAVGVGFGALSTIEPPLTSTSLINGLPANSTMIASSIQTYESEYQRMFDGAQKLAIGIGLQNFPEGLAVSLPLMRLGYSRSWAFFWGQLSAVVEPIGGVLGAWLIGIMKPLLPYALSFAAGAMVFVVVEDLIPETRVKGGFPTLASWGVIVGFIIMMSLDVGLG